MVWITYCRWSPVYPSGYVGYCLFFPGDITGAAIGFHRAPFKSPDTPGTTACGYNHATNGHVGC